LVDGTRIWVDVFGTIHVVMAVSGVCVDWTPATGRLTIDVPLVSLFVNRLGGLGGPLRNSTDGRLLVNGTDYSSRVWTFGLMSCVPADLRLLTIPPPLGWTSSCESIVPPFVDPPCSQVSTVCNTFLTPTPTTCVAGVTTLFYNLCTQAPCGSGFPVALMQQYFVTCPPPEVVIVEPPVDRCGVLFGDGSSCSLSFGVCSVVDTDHFRTFDGLVYDFAGRSDYYFVRDCSIVQTYQVQLVRRPCGVASCTVGVVIEAPSGVVVEFNATHSVVNRQATQVINSMQLSDGTSVIKQASGRVSVSVAGTDLTVEHVSEPRVWSVWPVRRAVE